MVSNRLTHRRTTISNPKICKSKLKPLRPLPPEEPPEWPPPYIHARIIALAYGQQFEATLTLEPDGSPGPTIAYFAHDFSLGLQAQVTLYTTETQNQITFYAIARGNPFNPFYLYAVYGPTINVLPPTFKLENSQWGYQIPPDATIQMAIAYPEQP